LPFFVTVRRTCATWAAPANPIQAGARDGLDRAAGPAAVVRAHRRDGGDASPGQLLELPVQRRHVALDRHHVIRVPASDDLSGVALRVQCVDRYDRAGQTGERFQQVPHRGDLVRLRGHRHLPEDRADAVRQRRHQVRGLPVLVLRAADGLAVDGDHQTAADLYGPGPQPGAEDLVEHVRADQGERAPERGLLRRAAGCAQPGQHVRPGIGGPLPDRGERPRPRDYRRDPDGEQPGQRMPPPALLPRVRDLAEEIEKVLAAGSRNGRRCHRRAGVPRGRR